MNDLHSRFVSACRRAFFEDECGASVAEYALVTAIVIGIVTAALSTGLSFDVFGAVSTRVADCADGACN